MSLSNMERGGRGKEKGNERGDIHGGSTTTSQFHPRGHW